MRPIKKMISLVLALMLTLAQISITVVSAQDNTALSFTVKIQESVMTPISDNQPTDEESEKFKALISKTASPPFYALIRDYPDITCWMNKLNINATSEIYGISGKNLYLKLESLRFDLLIHENYLDPKGMVDQINDAVNRFSPEGETMYEKLISIHDYVCDLTTYKSDNDGALYCYSAYGCMVDGRSVCEGYAEAFKILCARNGIDCIIVTGNAIHSGKTETHMWNYVRMDDGLWYAVDPTWDDASDIKGNYSYFLLGSESIVKNTPFSESHVPTYNFSGINIEDFAYPQLSLDKYDPNDVKQEYKFGKGERYYYSSLNEAQKEIYDAMYEAVVNNMPSNPDKTPNPAQTDDLFPPESSDDITALDSYITTGEGGAASSDIITSEEDTTLKSESTNISVTESSVNVTVTSDILPSTSKESDASVTTSRNNNASQYNKYDAMYEIAKVGLIICALASLGLILGVVIIKYSKKHSNDE